MWQHGGQEAASASAMRGQSVATQKRHCGVSVGDVAALPDGRGRADGPVSCCKLVELLVIETLFDSVFFLKLGSMPIAMHACALAGLGLAFVSLGREWAGTLAESSQPAQAGRLGRRQEEEEEGRWRSGRTDRE